MDPAAARTVPAGFSPLNAFRLLQSSGGAIAAHAQLHGQLAAVEWAEEKQRLLRMLAITLAGFACLLCTLLFAGGLALSVAWDTGYRIHVLAVLVLLFGCGTAAAWRRFAAISAASGRSFAASREEFAADAAVLKATL